MSRGTISEGREAAPTAVTLLLLELKLSNQSVHSGKVEKPSRCAQEARFWSKVTMATWLGWSPAKNIAPSLQDRELHLIPSRQRPRIDSASSQISRKLICKSMQCVDSGGLH